MRLYPKRSLLTHCCHSSCGLLRLMDTLAHTLDEDLRFKHS
ncbi:hypothetical protein [uncultured Helicobacter sp.]|nr:hypothetical protein [uncultured Helicobacter sp.]